MIIPELKCRVCHSVQHTTAELLGYLGVPLKTVNVPESADDIIINSKIRFTKNLQKCLVLSQVSTTWHGFWNLSGAERMHIRD